MNFRIIMIFMALAPFEILLAQDDEARIGAQEHWAASEYSGRRTAKDYQTAMLSKGFSWLSGSPADNEKLSIGKNAQFFGFVALRYQSGRAANRGSLGRAFFSIADEQQKQFLVDAVLSESLPLQLWWETRAALLRLYENHLYTGHPIDEAELAALSAEFAQLGAEVAVYEAQAFAHLEDSLSNEQRDQIQQWRSDPEISGPLSENVRVSSNQLGSDQYAQLENLFAKAFSWITGGAEDNAVIPLGQPAQFFGFVSIRHKSGHGANRGQIAKSFREILNEQQLGIIDTAIEEQRLVVSDFLLQRDLFLQQLELLRIGPDQFDQDVTMSIAVRMGALETQAGLIEAKAYREIRQLMSQAQIAQMMALRSNYVLDEHEVESLTWVERGEQLANLCFSCHGYAGQTRKNIIAPSLQGIFGRPIASAKGYEYSEALTLLGQGQVWAPETMDKFIASPKTFLPGTKMAFQGLLNVEDRRALIDYLQQTM